MIAYTEESLQMTSDLRAAGLLCDVIPLELEVGSETMTVLMFMTDVSEDQPAIVSGTLEAALDIVRMVVGYHDPERIYRFNSGVLEVPVL